MSEHASILASWLDPLKQGERHKLLLAHGAGRDPDTPLAHQHRSLIVW